MKKTLAICLLLLFAALFSPSAQGQDQLVILHTNDLHGQSLARLATLLAEQRELHPDLLWVDAGDLFSGTAISNLLQGKAEEAAVLELGLDAPSPWVIMISTSAWRPCTVRSRLGYPG